MRTVGSAPDPYTFPLRLPTGDYGEQLDLSSYTQVLSAITPGETTAGIIITGQSNVANFGNYTYTVTQAKSHQMNPLDGGVYQMKQPVLGCNGARLNRGTSYNGNWTARLGDKLISAGFAQRVIICNVAAGGTSSAQWAFGGDCNQRLVAACNRMKALMAPTLIIRHQGETDNALTFSADTVTANIRSEVDTIRRCGVTAPVMVCKVSYNGTGTTGTPASTAVRLGQTNALSSDLGIYVGIDTDIYNSSYRQDDLHWNATGADSVSTDMKNRIIGFFTP